MIPTRVVNHDPHLGGDHDHHQGVNDDPHQGGGAPPAGRRLHTFQGSLLTLSDKKCCQRGGAAPRDDACFLVDLESGIIFHTLLCEYLILAFHRSRCRAEVEVRLQDKGRKTDKG